MLQITQAISGRMTKSLPSGWVETDVASLCHIVGGGTPSTKIDAYWNGMIPWISSADIHGVKDIRPRRSITELAISESATNLVPRGSIVVVTRVGLGKVAMAHESLCFSQDSQGLVFNASNLHGMFLTYYLSQAVQRFRYEGRGTTISGVTKRQLRELPIPLPPLAEQRRIVAEIERHLTRLDASVAALKRVQANLKRYRASVLKDACEGKLVTSEAELARAEGRDYEPAEHLLKRILAKRRARWEAQKNRRGKYKERVGPDSTNLPKLPEGWSYVQIHQVLSLNRRGLKTGPFGSLLKKHEHKKDGVPVLGIENIKRMEFAPKNKIFVTSYKAQELSSYDVQEGDILISRSGTVGEACVVPPGLGDARLSTNLMRISLANNYVSPHYFSLLFNGSPTVLDQVSALCGGSTRDFLNGKILRSIVFPLPSLEEQHRIVAVVKRRLSIIQQSEAAVEANLIRAERLRQSILKQAFEGKLVPQEPNDEPASVLLERIRAEREAAQAKAKLSRNSRRRTGKSRKRQPVPKGATP